MQGTDVRHQWAAEGQREESIRLRLSNDEYEKVCRRS